MQFNIRKSFKQAGRSQVESLSFLFPEKKQAEVEWPSCRTPGSNLWTSRLKHASPSKAGRLGQGMRTRRGIIPGSTVSVSHEGSLVKHTLWFVHEIISVLVSTGLKAQ